MEVRAAVYDSPSPHGVAAQLANGRSNMKYLQLRAVVFFFSSEMALFAILRLVNLADSLSSLRMTTPGSAGRDRREDIVRRLLNKRRFANTVVIDTDNDRKDDDYKIQDLVDLRSGALRDGWGGYWTDASVRDNHLGARVVEIWASLERVRL
jgi:hypothetical protein